MLHTVKRGFGFRRPVFKEQAPHRPLRPRRQRDQPRRASINLIPADLGRTPRFGKQMRFTDQGQKMSIALGILCQQNQLVWLRCPADLAMGGLGTFAGDSQFAADDGLDALLPRRAFYGACKASPVPAV